MSDNENSPFNLPTMIKMVSDMRMGMEQMIEYCAMQAKLCKASYDALLKEGFSREQSIELLKARGSML